jgi:CDGSH-type Zn-finger protein
MDVRITPYPNGPYVVRGSFELTDVDGEVIAVRRKTIALCRCGRSQTKPFCDGTHKRIGFQAPSRAVAQPLRQASANGHVKRAAAPPGR